MALPQSIEYKNTNYRYHMTQSHNLTTKEFTMSTKLTSKDLIKHVEGYVSITDGVANIDNKQIQEACFLELGTSLADVKKAYDHTAMVENAIAHVFVEKAQDYLADHKDATVVAGNTKIGEEKISLTCRRDSESRNPQTGETSNHKGALRMTRTLNNRASEYTDIKTLARERGLNKL